MDPCSDKTKTCPYAGCGAAFNRPYKLAWHLLVHNNIKKFVCVEDNCSKSYSNKSHLDRHKNTVHVKKGNNVVYSCPTCLKVYTNRQNLKRHINVKHKVNIPFYCDICKLEFRKKHLLTAHMFQHTGVKSFNCEMCNKDFISLYEKKKHMRLHKVYKCDECPLSFKRWSIYQYHKKLEHTKKEFICSDCGRKFKERGHIVRHMKVHTQELVKVYRCPYENCSREYSRNSNLKQHILIKHVKVKHECHMCNAKLSTKACLQRHIKSHSTPKVIEPVKTLETGRKPRKDVGKIKNLSALKLAGLDSLEQIKDIPDDSDSLMPKLLEESVSLLSSMAAVQV
ncbi:hypothetical protein K1T71_005197 [Dendrolimus kikuchii]|uniref:Uncharacterized protein n=1 Tax=Dendrolimus kikuchii TaxID=765133 RepID=A0ACC1D6P8_9NEOP|nr:hypothetical protein K1T71_005197 [Dendrolimus kikuchii]